MSSPVTRLSAATMPDDTFAAYLTDYPWQAARSAPERVTGTLLDHIVDNHPLVALRYLAGQLDPARLAALVDAHPAYAAEHCPAPNREPRHIALPGAVSRRRSLTRAP